MNDEPQDLTNRDGAEPGAPPAQRAGVRPIEYPIATKALAKWMNLYLQCRREPEGLLHYSFRFLGSTCSSGGIPIASTLHALVREGEGGVVVENGWIEIAPDDQGLRAMCEYGVRGAALLDSLRQPPEFCGRTLEEILTEPLAVNPAGCFCKPPMINHKWRQMLATIHYALSVGSPPAP
jgi:hypothetical protein